MGTRIPRSTTTRDLHRRIIRRDQPPCSLCGKPIDYSLPHLDPGEFTVDHVVPLALGGPDTLENKAAAHRKCNRDKGIGRTKQPRLETVATSRTW